MGRVHRVVDRPPVTPKAEKEAEKKACTCRRPARGLMCRCLCDKCKSRDLGWQSWGAYLDKDLVCRNCGYVQDIWNC